MKKLHRILTLSLGAAFFCLGVQTTPAQEKKSEMFENLFLDVTFGAERIPGQHVTHMESFGFNWGVPLTKNTDGKVFGFQFGADMKNRTVGLEFDFTTGLFVRNLKWSKDRQAALALLVDFRHTAFENNIWGVRPIFATTLSKKDTIALSGVIGVNFDSNVVAGLKHTERMISRFETYWTHEWTPKIITELSAGYHFYPVEETSFGVQFIFSLSPYCDISLGGDINTYADYSAGITFNLNFAGNGRHASVHNARGTGKDLSVPFPKRSFPRVIHADEMGVLRRRNPALGVPPPPPPPPPPGGSGSND